MSVPIIYSSLWCYHHLTIFPLLQRRLGSKSWSYSTKSTKSSDRVTELYADISDEHDDYKDLEGEIYIKFNKKDKMDISYELHNLPEKCKEHDCYIAIHENDSCSRPKDEYFSGSSDENPWGDDSSFTTSHNGLAGGTISKVDNGKDGKDNTCKALLIYGPEDSSSSNAETEVIGCGLLYPEGKSEDYC